VALPVSVAFRRILKPTESAGLSPADGAHCELSEHCECPVCFVGALVLRSGSDDLPVA
jgi:hypothetical protein